MTFFVCLGTFRHQSCGAIISRDSLEVLSQDLWLLGLLLVGLHFYPCRKKGGAPCEMPSTAPCPPWRGLKALPCPAWRGPQDPRAASSLSRQEPWAIL